MSQEQYFSVSYSRRELYFAESLVLSLQELGFNIFFDLQQLEPGDDWQTTLQYGFTNCAAVILVVSKASMDSPYVQKEWEGALKNNIPVICCMFEPMELPEGLKNCPRYDFRVGFKHKLAQLTEHLKGGEARYDKVPLHYRSLRLKIQRPVMFTALALMVLPITSFLTTIWSLQYPEIAITFLGLTYFAARAPLNLLRRKITFKQLRLALFWHFIFMLGFVFASLISSLVESSPTTLPLISGTVYLVVIMFLNILGMIPILSWFGVGGGEELQSLREKYHGKMIAHIDRGTAVKLEDEHVNNEELYTPGTYRLLYDDKDRGFAEHLRHELERRKVSEQHEGARESAIPLVIISDLTQDADVRKWIEADKIKNPIFVMIEEYHLSEEVEKMMLKYQYFDMRKDNKLEYNTLAGYIKGDNLTTSINITPDNLKKNIRSAPVGRLRWSLVASGIYMLFHSFVISDDPTQVSSLLVQPVIIISFLIGIIQLIVAIFVGARRIRYRYFNMMFGIACLVILTYALPASSPTTLQAINATSPGWLLAVFYFIPFLLILWSFYRKSYWLPR